jgi:hypothetical protein
MRIFDPETQKEVSSEFTLKKESYDNATDKYYFSSKYFEWAGEFFRYQQYDV